MHVLASYDAIVSCETFGPIFTTAFNTLHVASADQLADLKELRNSTRAFRLAEVQQASMRDTAHFHAAPELALRTVHVNMG